jgi:histidyl-tRNA synthetase
VWRADRPQRGRYRQFTQCDIDILGEPTNMAEIELILATTTTLGRLGFRGFEIRLNERRLLKAMAAFAGFASEDYDNVFIILDKMDKIGQQGVKEELLAEGYDRDAVKKYLGLFEALADKKDVASGVGYLQETLQDSLDEEVSRNLLEIAAAVETAREADFSLVFDPTLVRGMSYYTGTIFEIAIPQFGGSCGGGGRYDEMIGKFTGQSVPACGFSIGFERIILLLLEQGYEIPERPRKVAYLVEKKYPAGDLPKVLTQAKEAREKGQQVLVVRMNKNKKFQKEQLEKEGYSEFVEFFAR